MKTIYIARHAKSSWSNSNLSDFDRPLNERGLRDAPYMGSKLKEKGVNPQLIVSSSALRAFTTAKIIAKKLGYSKDKIRKEELIYDAYASDLLEYINNLNDKLNNVMLFGHNPGFTSLSNYLTGIPIDNIPTCGIVKITFDVDNWKEIAPSKGELIFFDYPKKH